MSITDGTRGVTRVNGTDQAVKMVKVSETDDEEVYDLEPEEPEQPVDQPDPRPPADTRGTEARRPILPTWLRSKDEFTSMAKWTAIHYGHTATYHGVRVPWYGLKATATAPAGGMRLVAGTWRWVSDAEGRPVRGAAVRKEDADRYLALSRQRNDRVRLRAAVLVVASVMGLAMALTLYIVSSGWLLTFGALVVLTMGYVGAPADRPLIGAAVIVPKAQKLTSDLVLSALENLGIGLINKAVAKGKPALVFTAPITRDGPGWRAEGDLPPGATAGDVAEKRAQLASALRRPLGCVWPEGAGEEHPGRLILWIGDEDMAKSKQPLWPLLKSGTVDLFRPTRFGTDQRGRPVDITLMFASMLIGAIPRMGKTVSLRLVLLMAALDPRAELHAFDLKGTGDLSAVEPVAHAYRAGEEDEDIEYALADMRELKQGLRRRAKVIRGLPKDICPDSKVTPDLANKRALGLHPIVIGVDECQVWFEHETYGAELESICTDLVKRGPALGIVLILATQRPDSKSLPTGISANAVLRLCLKVMGQIENDMVLGTSSYKAGVRATMFTRSDVGICYIASEGDDPRITRGHYVNAPDAVRVVERAHKVRKADNRLSGYALGHEPADLGPSFDLLADILAVVAAEEEKVWNERVATRLGQLRPDAYGGWTTENVTVALKPFGVPVKDVAGTTDEGARTTRRGIERAAIVAAVNERNRAK
jgi:S-DNA-T family DNA segregation ATPase FtsK/SpoIIIE